jgi:Carboxypeptidase regulatory-like domain
MGAGHGGRGVAGRLLRNRYVVMLGALALLTAAWNGYVATRNDGIVEGRVVDAAGRPLAGATVILHERTLTTLEPRARATTGPDGTFRFEGQPAHHLVLVAEKAGLGATPRLGYRRWFRGQNLVLPAPLRLPATGS